MNVTVGPVPQARWSAICQDCSGAIDSLIELLQGRFSNGVMTRLCDEKTGLFPSPKDIPFTCSCPDWASMCKHVAAVLYGIGARFDHQPELLFTLRQINQEDLVANGIDMAPPARPAQARAKGVPTRHSTAFTTAAASTQMERTRPGKSKNRAPKGEGQRLTSKQRQGIAERMRTYWAERRAQTQKRKAAKL